MILVEVAEHALIHGDGFRLEFAFHCSVSTDRVEVVTEHPLHIGFKALNALAVHRVSQEAVPVLHAHGTIEHAFRIVECHVVILRYSFLYLEVIHVA